MTGPRSGYRASPDEIADAYREIGVALDGEDPPCRQFPDMWFPSKGSGWEVAKKTCRELCPAREQCLAYAVLAGETQGIWGGVAAPGHSRHRNRKTDSTRDPDLT